MQALRDAAAKVKELEQRVVALEKGKADKSDVDEMRTNLYEHGKTLGNHRERIEKLENQMSQALKSLEDMKRRIAGLSAPTGGSNIDEGALNELKLRVDHNTNDINSLKDELARWIREFQE